jgi:hypothetical protein
VNGRRPLPAIVHATFGMHSGRYEGVEIAHPTGSVNGAARSPTVERAANTALSVRA